MRREGSGFIVGAVGCTDRTIAPGATPPPAVLCGAASLPGGLQALTLSTAVPGKAPSLSA